MTYSLLRIALFLVATGVLWGVGMRSWLAPALALTLIITATALLAQVPQLPNYQRRVAVGK